MKTATRLAEQAPAVEAPKRDVRGKIVIGIAAFVILWTLVAGIEVLLASTRGRSGWHHASAARAFGTGRLADVDRELAIAQRDFDGASAASGSVFVAPFRVVPVLGTQLSSLNALAASAGNVVRAGRDALADARRALGGTSPSSAKGRVKLLRGISTLAGAFDTRLGSVDLGPRTGLMWPVASQHTKAVKQIAEMRAGAKSAAAGAQAMAQLFTGPSRYVLFEANNAEMRAGAGAFLRANALDIRNGKISIGSTVATGDLNFTSDKIGVTPQIQKLWGWLHPVREWRNLGVTPDFRETADLATRMWEARGGGRVDGALVVDAPALAALLKVTGPIRVAGHTITSSNAVDYLTHGQYVNGSDYGQRMDRQGDVARATLAAIDKGAFKPADLIPALATAARGRHLMVWSRDPKLEDLWTRAHVDGSLAKDSLLASVISRGGNKLDRFLDVSSTITSEHKGGNTYVHVAMTMHNRTPAGEPWYIQGPNPLGGAPKGVYVGIATVYLPHDALNIAVGREQLSIFGRDRDSVVAGVVVRVGRGATKTVNFTYALRGVGHTVRIEPSARVPAISWHFTGGSAFGDDRARTVKL